MSLRPRARHTAGHPTSTPHNHNTACADLGSGIYSMHFFNNSTILFNATAILAPSRHHAGTCHTVGQTQHTPLRHAGGPEALLRVLCRYLKRVSDRSTLPTNTATNRRHRGYQRRTTCSTETDACITVCRRLGRDGVGVYDGRGNGMVIRGDALSPTLARGHLTVGPPRGRGPRPCVPFLGPLPQCNTVWHTRPRLIICPACTAL